MSFSHPQNISFILRIEFSFFFSFFRSFKVMLMHQRGLGSTGTNECDNKQTQGTMNVTHFMSIHSYVVFSFRKSVAKMSTQCYCVIVLSPLHSFNLKFIKVLCNSCFICISVSAFYFFFSFLRAFVINRIFFLVNQHYFLPFEGSDTGTTQLTK